MLSQKRVNEMDKQLLHYKFNEMPKHYFQTYHKFWINIWYRGTDYKINDSCT